MKSKLIDLKRLTTTQAIIGVLMVCTEIGLVSAVITYQWKAANIRSTSRGLGAPGSFH
jgi:hypothetical protein